MADTEDFPVQEHELPGLGKTVAQKLTDELESWSRSAPPSGPPRPLWVLAGLHAAQDELMFRTALWARKARAAGSSWSEIGEALGMTKQAAQQRFGGKKE